MFIKSSLLLSKLMLFYWHLIIPNMHEIFLQYCCMKLVPGYSQKEILNSLDMNGTSILLTHFRPMFHLWINQVADFY